MRGNTLSVAHQTTLGLSRGMINSVDDSQMLQVVVANMLHEEQIEDIERFQTYGHHSVPLKSSMVDGEMKGAEVIVGFVAGQREHPIVLGTSDRRFEPTNWKPGDAGTYHHSGASAKHTDDGFVHDQGSQKKPLTWTTGKGSVKIEDGQVTITDDKATVVVAGAKITLTMGSTKVILKDGVASIVADKIELGAEGASIPVMLQTGPSSKVFASA